MQNQQVKNVVVAGAAGNLGQKLVSKLLARGCRVVCLSHTEQGQKDLIKAFGDNSDKHLILPGDLSHEATTTAIIAKALAFLGGIDALLCAQGSFHYARVEDSTEAQFDQLFDSNFKVNWLLARAVLVPMKKAKFGRIVFVSSRTSKGQGEEGMSLYLASKAGLNMLTFCLAREVRSENITVNSVLPSVIDSSNNRQSMPHQDFGQWVPADSVAKTMLALLSDDMCAVNGALISLPGKL